MNIYAEKMLDVLNSHSEVTPSSVNPAFNSLGITPVSFGDGKAVLKMKVQPGFINGAGFLQGGFYVILADEAIALAILSSIDEKHGTTTISETTEFLKGVNEGELYASAKVVRMGRRIIFAESIVTLGSEDGKVLSKTSASYLITEFK